MKMNCNPRFQSDPLWQKVCVATFLVCLVLGTGFWLRHEKVLNQEAKVFASTDLSVLHKMKPIAVKETPSAVQGSTEDLKNSNWYTTVQQEMSKSEYFIKEDAVSGILGSPNRKNNLRFTYDANGFSVQPRTTKIPLEEMKPGQHPDDIKYKTIKDWAIRFELNNSQWGEGYWKIANNKAEYVTPKVTVQYDNQEEGMRQNFVVQAPLAKGKKLAVGFKVSSTLKVNTNSKEMNFSLKGEQVMQYKDLKVWDANGKTLVASIQNQDRDNYIIEVDDREAIYPITIDPISTTFASRVESNQVSANLGSSVAGAGDVNGDGYSDVIVGAKSYDNGETDEGAAFVYHGSASGISTTAAAMVECNQATAWMGYSVAGAGDINGDGYSDVIVGAKLYDNGESNEGAAFVYHGSASGISTTAALMVESNQASAWMGESVAGAGDVNGDGYSDVLVGLPSYSNGELGEGVAALYYGSVTGISTSAMALLEANQAAATFGQSVAGAGDVNGDGYSDVVVGSNNYDNVESAEGAFYVYHGSASGISTTAAAIGESNQASAQLGASVSGAGDVNGDGYSDVIVGAGLYGNGETNEGAAFIYHGSSTGISTTASTMVESNQASAYLGNLVSGAGDVNGDGYSDVIVAAPFYDNGESNEGAAFVYHGSASGISTTAAAMVESNQASAYMGNSVAGAGDVNGDGFSDVIVGSAQYDNGESNEGAAFVYNGSASGVSTTAGAMVESHQVSANFGISVSGAGDVNGDGFNDVIVGAYSYDNGETDEGAAFVYHGRFYGISTTRQAILESNQAAANFGYSVSGAGDVNGDGYSDVVVGSYNYDNVESGEGAAFVYHGSASGISTTAAAMVESNQASAFMGISVSGAGDVNGDGYSDIIVGAWKYDNGQADEGAAFVYHGSATGISTTAATMVESNQANTFLGSSVSGAGDVNGDGYSDVIVGAMLYDNGQADEGAAFVYHGSATGISTTAATMVESNQANANMGISVAGTGDLNGDGYSDVIVGASLYDFGQSNEGTAFVYFGNDGGNRAAANMISAYNTDLSTRINQSNVSQTSFGASLFAKSFQGKTKGKLVWEVVSNGVPFSGGSAIGNSVSNTSQQSGFTDLGLNGVSLANTIAKTASKTSKVRVRVKYDLITSLNGQVFGPWRYLYNNNDLQQILKVSATSNTWTGAVSNLWNVAGNWSLGTVPTSTETFTIATGTPQLDVDFSVGGNMTISGTGNLTVMPGITLSVAAGGTADFGGNSVTFKSNATGTAQLGQVLGTLSNASNVTMERYIPARRAYRFIASPVTTTTSIKQNWMENATLGATTGYPFAAGSAVNPTAGFGTHITGASGNTNGFDATANNNPSLFTFNNAIQSWVASTNTNATLAAGDAYRLFVRGDRGTDLNSNAAAPSATVLRTTGTPFVGTKNYTTSSTAGAWNLVGNPYQSTIDGDMANFTNITGYYYAWDPKMGTRGAYVAYDFITGINSFTGSQINKYFQPGQAFFVQTDLPIAWSASVTESMKASAANQTDVFQAAVAYPMLNATIHYTDSLAKNAPAMDGFKLLFDNSFSNNVDRNDAQKLTNQDENIAINQAGTLLSIEKRQLYNAATEIAISTSNYVRQQYTVQLSWNNPIDNGFQAQLVDTYTNTSTPIAFSGNTNYAYTVDNAIAATKAADRFKIVFVPNAALPVSGIELGGTATDKQVKLSFKALNEREMSNYAIERSADGISFTKIGTQQPSNAAQASASYSFVDNQPIVGNNYYRIKGSSINGQIQFSNVAVVKYGVHVASVSVVPNPIQGKTVNLKLSQLAKGSYNISVTDVFGRSILQKEMLLDGSSTVQLHLPASVSAGNYFVKVDGQGAVFVQNFIIQ